MRIHRIEMANQIAALRKENNGKLPSYAWPGGYPIFYMDAENSALCPTCANKPGYPAPVTAWGINWEDSELYCDDCSQRIESAYAED